MNHFTLQLSRFEGDPDGDPIVLAAGASERALRQRRRRHHGASLGEDDPALGEDDPALREDDPALRENPRGAVSGKRG